MINLYTYIICIVHHIYTYKSVWQRLLPADRLNLLTKAGKHMLLFILIGSHLYSDPMGFIHIYASIIIALSFEPRLPTINQLEAEVRKLQGLAKMFAFKRCRLMSLREAPMEPITDPWDWWIYRSSHGFPTVGMSSPSKLKGKSNHILQINLEIDLCTIFTWLFSSCLKRVFCDKKNGGPRLVG